MKEEVEKVYTSGDEYHYRHLKNGKVRSNSIESIRTGLKEGFLTENEAYCQMKTIAKKHPFLLSKEEVEHKNPDKYKVVKVI
jgi:hypothetical protein